MNDEDRRKLGEETIKDVYAGDVIVPPEGYTFSDVMLKQLFAEVWARDVLPKRDVRLLLLGIIAEKGEVNPFKIQIKAALKRGELDAEQARELLLFIAQYAGYPRASSMLGAVESAIAEYQKESPSQA